MHIKKLASESDKEPSPFYVQADSETSSPLKVESPVKLRVINTKELAQDKSAEQKQGPEEQEDLYSAIISPIVPMMDPIEDLDQSINIT